MISEEWNLQCLISILWQFHDGQTCGNGSMKKLICIWILSEILFIQKNKGTPLSSHFLMCEIKLNRMICLAVILMLSGHSMKEFFLIFYFFHASPIVLEFIKINSSMDALNHFMVNLRMPLVKEWWMFFSLSEVQG